MPLTNKKKHQIRWEVIDAAFTRVDNIAEGTNWFLFDDEEPQCADVDGEELTYMRDVIRRVAKQLNVNDHTFL